MTPGKVAARAILEGALHAVDVRKAVREQIQVFPDSLTIAGRAVSLEAVDEILLVAVGKAALPMYEAAEEVLRPASLYLRSIVVAPEEFRRRVRGEFFAGGHPLPNLSSMQAARAALSLLKEATKSSAVLYLISGGASAMMETSMDDMLTLSEMQQIYLHLIGSGLGIGAINSIRKHVSAVKGGRLAQAASRAAVQWSLLVSDVPAATPDVIGSGPSLPDPSTLQEARQHLDASNLSSAVRVMVQALMHVETPKSEDSAFERASWKVVLSSEDLAESAARIAREWGYAPVIDNTCDEWEYREASEYLLQRASILPAKSCLISVGEVIVALDSQPGVGGRNQQFALYCALELPKLGREITVLSAGSDGMDGNSAHAGAVADSATVRAAALSRMDAEAMFAAFNAAPLFEALGDAVAMGPTGNNLRDLRLFLVD